MKNHFNANKTLGGSVVLVSAFLLALGSTAVADHTSNMTVSFSTNQMEWMGPYSMAPATIGVAGDMMLMDSMTLDCRGDEPVAVVYKAMSTEQVTMDSGATQTTWRGIMKGGLGFATMMQTSDGSMTGTFSTQDAAYSVMTDLNGNSQMKMTRWVDFAPEGDEHEATRRTTTGTRFLSEPTAVLQAPPMTMAGNMVSKKVRDIRPNLKGPSRRFLGSTHRALQISSVRVLLIVTNAAMCEYVGLAAGCDASSSSTPFADRVPLLQDEMISAMQGVGVNAEIQIVDVIYLAPGYDVVPDDFVLDQVSADSTIAQWRQDSQADLVAFITHSGGNYCGIAHLPGAFSVTSVSCLDG